MPIVHAGYAKRRRKMLKAGVVLYELMRVARVRSRRDRRLTGSSGSSLHAKTFSVDRARVFVGSFNLDPRSASLNTEMGLVIESPALAAQIAAAFAEEIPARSYRVSLNEAGRLQWLEQHENGAIVHKTEPGVTWWKRVAVRLMALLPIEALGRSLVIADELGDDVGDRVHHELRLVELRLWPACFATIRLLSDDSVSSSWIESLQHFVDRRLHFVGCERIVPGRALYQDDERLVAEPAGGAHEVRVCLQIDPLARLRQVRTRSPALQELRLPWRGWRQHLRNLGISVRMR